MHHLLDFLAFRRKLLFLAPTTHCSIIGLSYGKHSLQGWTCNKFWLFINTFYFLFLFYYSCYTPLLKGYKIVFFIFISLMMSDIEHLFMYFLVIYISSLEKCLFKSFAHFSLGCLCYWVIRVLSMFWILGPYQIWPANIFSQPVGCIFTFLTISFDCTKTFNFDEI